jgi:diacylglycerol O-acyltransferase / wax synthase
MQRLGGLDTSFIYLDSPAAPMHVAMICIFDPHGVQDGYSFEKVRARVAARLHLVPPFRRRLVSMPGHVHRPLWIDDPEFDLDEHLRRATLPAPAGASELERFAADVVSRPLDRTRPLWEMHFVEGLDDGMVAVVTKMHHATVDGVSAAELAAHLLDLDPDAPATSVPPPAWEPAPMPSSVRLLWDAAYDLARQPIDATATIVRTVGAWARLRAHRRDPRTANAPGLASAPRTCTNDAITKDRHVTFAELSLDDVKQIKHTTGTTINDIVLTVCGRALRDHLRDHGALPDRSLVAGVPVSVRGDEQPGIANQLSAMLVDLATDIEDPLVHLAAIAVGSRAAKEHHERLGHDTLSRLAALVPPAVLAAIGAVSARLNAAGRSPTLCNVVVSNFPGPPFPLYLAGANMVAAYPIGPLAVGTGLNITVQSYLDTLWFGILSCPDALPAPDELPQRMNTALHDLTKSILARASAPS